MFGLPLNARLEPNRSEPNRSETAGPVNEGIRTFPFRADLLLLGEFCSTDSRTDGLLNACLVHSSGWMANWLSVCLPVVSSIFTLAVLPERVPVLFNWRWPRQRRQQQRWC